MYKKYKNRLEKFLQTERGKRFLNFAYSFGAAIVILGAMFKLLYLPFGNLMLAIGMITEIGVFILSAFDTPVKDYNWEEVFPVLANNNSDKKSDLSTEKASLLQEYKKEYISAAQRPLQTEHTHEKSIVTDNHENTQNTTLDNLPDIQSDVSQPLSSGHKYSEDYINQLSSASDHVKKFSDATAVLVNISKSLQDFYQDIINNSHNINENSLGYIQQMETLNRNITGLNTIYEIQLKSISGQLDTIEQINNGLTRIKTMYNEAIPDSSVIKQQTDKMANQIKELNQVYARMLEAMTTNMTRNV